MSGDADARRELRELARAVRAHAEWQAETGATGLPRAKRAAPSASSGAEAPKARPSAAPSVPTRLSDVETPARRPAQAGVQPTSALPVPAIPEGREARKARLVELASSIKSCEKCVLHATRTQTVFSRGNPGAELCFVGEGPGADEDAQGEPFVGKAGQLLDKMIAAMGYGRDEVYICNIVKCRPPNNRKPEPAEVTACTPYLAEQLALLSPKVIVALGATAVEGLIGISGGITRMRGQWKLYRGTIPVMPTFHPAYLLRNPPAKRDVWADLQAVLKHLGRPVPTGKG